VNSAQALAGRRVVVTGGAGLIGSRLAAALAGVAESVTVIDAMVPEHGGNRRNLAGLDVRLVERDIADLPSLDGADVVFNLAGQRSHTDSMVDPLTDLHHNCHAQLALLETCRTTAPDALVLYASTRQIYGRVAHIPADESTPVAPCDINGIHKAAAEHYHRLYHDVHGLRTVSLRLTNTYGPGMRIRDARQGFLGAWFGALTRGERFEVWGGDQIRDLNHVDDVVDAFLRAAAEPRAAGRVFNLGGPPVSLRGLAELLGGSYDVVPLPEEARRIDIGDYAGDYSAFRALTGWEPRVELANGLRETLAYFRADSEHYL
jgi:UDP-glucose 4-epimerase